MSRFHTGNRETLRRSDKAMIWGCFFGWCYLLNLNGSAPLFGGGDVVIIWVLPKIGGKPPKWTVKIMENPHLNG